MEQMFLPPSLHSSHQQPFYPTTTQPMFPYTTQQECYPDFTHQAWTDLPLLGPQQEFMPTDHVPPSSIFPAFDSSGYGIESTFIPPAPQSPSAFENSTRDHQQPQSYLSPPLRSNTRSSQTSHHSRTASSLSRSCSPSLSIRQSSTSSRHSSTVTTAGASETTSLLAYGIPVHASNTSQSQTWRCAYPGCTSRALFTRGCDLRKHFNRHSKHLFCRVDGCPQSEAAALAADNRSSSGHGRRSSSSTTTTAASGGGFSSKKDRARHEAKHNPGIRCEWQGLDGEECGRVFSRMDNMKDHVRRIHRKGQR